MEAGKPLVIEQIEATPPKTMEVRVKIKYTALCRTDFYFWEAKGVTDFQVGDHVLQCLLENVGSVAIAIRDSMCDLLRMIPYRGVMLNDRKSRFSLNGNPVYHFIGTSTFSEYTVLHSGCLVKINPLAPLDKACTAGVSQQIPIHDNQCLDATLNVAKPKKGSTVAVFRLGAVGLAPRSLASQTLLVQKIVTDQFKRLKEMTDRGVDRSIECTGNVDVMISAFECVHEWMRVAVLCGVPSKDAVFMTKPINMLNERTLKGTFFGNYNPKSDLPSVVDMFTKEEMELDKFITYRVSFSEINKAFEYMQNGEGLRCIISMED
ncbi:alcohol dehydrogenase [Bienertia sinuspersici]